ncbi:MAG: hypothetical protein L0Y74_06475 [candidate division Zixibacteria bacterium]|nr:hypothetical protein [candidate division Zixibacteria bacterium]
MACTGSSQNSKRLFLAFRLLAILALLTAVNSKAENMVDPGQPDTVWIVCQNEAVPDTGSWISMNIYLKTDNQGSGNDVTAFDLPLYLSRSNTAPVSVDTTVTAVFANSVFKDSSSYFRAVSADSQNLDCPVVIGAVKFSGTGFSSGTHILATLRLKLDDSTTLDIDTTSTSTNSLQLVTSSASGYVPVWNVLTCPVCVHSSPAGDANCSGGISLADVIYLVNYLFKSWPAPCCFSLGDVNCSGSITLADIIQLVNHIFKAQPAPQLCP